MTNFNNLILYRTYYKDNQLPQCNTDCKYIKIINTNDEIYPLSKDLNIYWSEYALMKEIWLQGKQSEYIGFDQYSKKFNENIEINTDIIFRKKFIFNTTIYNQYKYHHGEIDINELIKILNIQYGDNNDYVKYIKNSKTLLAQSCFILKWDIFNNMCKFIFGCLDQLDSIYNLNFDQNNYFKYFSNRNISKYNYRTFGYLAERLVSAYLIVNYTESEIKITN